MRINKFVAAATGMSRRAADAVVAAGRVTVNGIVPDAGQMVQAADTVTLDGKPLATRERQTVLFNKPAGYVTSREGQGAATIYDILPTALHYLKPIGRLDKDSSGLLLLTNDGDLAQELTHPKYQKVKIYEVTLDKPLAPLHRQMISEIGLQLEDGLSKLQVERLIDSNDFVWNVTMHEGRNRQIRRTFAALGYTVKKLHRTQFGIYKLQALKPGAVQTIDT